MRAARSLLIALGAMGAMFGLLLCHSKSVFRVHICSRIPVQSFHACLCNCPPVFFSVRNEAQDLELSLLGRSKH